MAIDKINNTLQSIVIIGNNSLLNVNKEYLESTFEIKGTINGLKPWEVSFSNFNFSTFQINNGDGVKIYFQLSNQNNICLLYKIINEILKNNVIYVIGINFVTSLQEFDLNNILNIEHINTNAINFFVSSNKNEVLTLNISYLAPQRQQIVVQSNMEYRNFNKNSKTLDQQMVDKIDEQITEVLNQLINGR